MAAFGAVRPGGARKRAPVECRAPEIRRQMRANDSRVSSAVLVQVNEVEVSVRSLTRYGAPTSPQVPVNQSTLLRPALSWPYGTR